MRKIRENYRHTIYASYLGYVTQAVVNNFAPLLFLTFQKSYGISLEQIALLVSINFGIQLLVDLFAVRFVDKIGYRICIVVAHVTAAAGLVSLSFLPDILGNHYAGLLLSVMIYAIGGGLLEVLVSPIVEACPTENKEGMMSVLHSFYCWGSVGVALLSTMYFQFAGIENWRILTCLWAILPACNAIYYSQVPMYKIVEENEGMSVKQLFSMKLFWVFILLMVCSGASEQAMSQWASVFAEAGLKVSKTVGDLAGPCCFSILMGTARLLYGKYSVRVNLKKMLVRSSLLCVCSYLLAVFAPLPVLSLVGCGLCGFSVGIMWPGVFSLGSAACPTGGTAMFAFFALAGDLGCSLGPAVVGVVSEQAGNVLQAGLLAAVIFPAVLICGIFLMTKFLHQKNKAGY